jgi:hypothetical protein
LYINSTGWLKNGNLSANVTLTREYLGSAIQRNWLGIPYDCIVVKDTTEMKGYFTEGSGNNVTYKDFFSKNVTKKYIVSSLSFENSTIFYEYNLTETYDNLTTNKTGTYFPKNSPTIKPIGIEDLSNFRAIRPRVLIPGDKVIIPSFANSSILLSLEYSSSEERIIYINSNSQKIYCIKIIGTISKKETSENLGSCSYLIASSHQPGLLLESYEKITYLGNEMESTHLLRDIVL